MSGPGDEGRAVLENSRAISSVTPTTFYDATMGRWLTICQRTFFKRLLAVVLLTVLAAIAVTGCNTARGVGVDLQEGGKALQNAAENAKK
jgi:entericidin B